MKSLTVKKTLLIILLSVSLIFFSIGCASDKQGVRNNTQSAPSGSAGFTSRDKPAFVGEPDEIYYFVTFNSGVDYWVSLYEGFKDIGRQLGVKTGYAGTPDYDINAEVTVFEQIVAKKPNGIFLCPLNGNAFIDPVKKSFAQEIPVTIFANDAPGLQKLCFINSNNEAEGRMAADFIGKELNGKGEIGVLENVGQTNHEARVSSLIQSLKENWPDVRVVARENCMQDTARAATAVRTMLQAHPNIKFIYSVEASSGAGGAIAAEELNKGIKVITFDASPDVLDMVKSGKIYAAIMPDAYTQGYMGLLPLFLVNHKLFEPMNDYTKTGNPPFYIPYIENSQSIITKDNADYFYTSRFLQKRKSKGFDESGDEMQNPGLPGFWRR